MGPVSISVLRLPRSPRALLPSGGEPERAREIFDVIATPRRRRCRTRSPTALTSLAAAGACIAVHIAAVIVVVFVVVVGRPGRAVPGACAACTTRDRCRLLLLLRRRRRSVSGGGLCQEEAEEEEEDSGSAASQRIANSDGSLSDREGRSGQTDRQRPFDPPRPLRK